MARYRTKENEALDWICFQHYRDSNVIPRVLEANPGLADYGELLPAGLVIELPELPSAPLQDTIRLWD